MSQGENLSILSPDEKFVYYGLPDFNDEQRSTYFTFTENECDLIFRCKEEHAQVYCALSIGYFKAKNIFFKFSLNSVPKEDVTFLLDRYFENKILQNTPLTKNEYYFQQNSICKLYGYSL